MTSDESSKNSTVGIFRQCQSVFPEWGTRPMSEFEFDDPKGFSSFTMGIRSKKQAHPSAVLYRRLEGKDNAILDYKTEKSVFLTLGAHDIAAHCHHYDDVCRIEAFYRGRTLEIEDLQVPGNLRQIADRLYRFHRIEPPGLPARAFFELLHEKWGRLAKRVLEHEIDRFPPNEQAMCEQLRGIYSSATRDKVQSCLPEGELTFCHNDTYHGNIMKLDSGEIRLLDFEFSCLNHKTYDFANLFAETVMRHQQPDYPYFTIAEPEFGDREIGMLIDYYLENVEFSDPQDRQAEFSTLLTQTKTMLMMPDYKYAMAALPLAVEPIQKIRFIPYAFQRYKRFLEACKDQIGN